MRSLVYRSPSIEGQLSSVYGQLKLDGIEKKAWSQLGRGNATDLGGRVERGE